MLQEQSYKKIVLSIIMYSVIFNEVKIAANKIKSISFKIEVSIYY